MKYGYIGIINSITEFKEYILLFEKQGVGIGNVIINQTFDDFVDSTVSGDVVVVYSFTQVFKSITSMLYKVTDLFNRGVVVLSLSEPEIEINRDNIDLITQLCVLSDKIKAITTRRGVSKAKSIGKKLGRPSGNTLIQKIKVIEVDRLREKTSITVTKACKIVGCQPRTYYRIKNKLRCDEQQHLSSAE